MPDYGIPWVPANASEWCTAGQLYWLNIASVARCTYSNYYGLLEPRLRRHRNRPRHVRGSSTTSTSGCSCATRFRYGQTHRDSIITAPRYINCDRSTVAINRQFQSRDQDDTIIAEQSRRFTFELQHLGRASTISSRASISSYEEVGELRAALGSSTVPMPISTIPNPGHVPITSRIAYTGAVNEADADAAGIYPRSTR